MTSSHKTESKVKVPQKSTATQLRNNFEPDRTCSGKEIILAIREFAVEDKSKSWFFTLSTLLLLILLFVGSACGPNIYVKMGCSFSGAFVFYSNVLFLKKTE